MKGVTNYASTRYYKVSNYESNQEERAKSNGPLFRNVVILRTPSKVVSVFCFMYYIYCTFLQLAQIYLNRTNICHIFAYCFNLIVPDPLGKYRQVENILAISHNICSHFNQSFLWLITAWEGCRNQTASFLLQQRERTRWNSSLSLLQQL